LKTKRDTGGFTPCRRRRENKKEEMEKNKIMEKVRKKRTKQTRKKR
jgi:hypothetical protein